MTVMECVAKPVAILLLVLATLFVLDTPVGATDRDTNQYIQSMQADRRASEAKAAFFIVIGVVLFAAALTAAPITGGTSVVAVAALTGSITAGAAGAAHQMDANKLRRRINIWSEP